MKNSIILPLIAIFLTLTSCARPPLRPPVEPPATLMPDRANPNAAELDAFARSYPDGTEEAGAAAFLLANLPPADRLSMTAADLRENSDYAFLARRTLPWGSRVPWDIFRHYVLPHRASQEPFQPNRAMLFAELAPLCATAGSMEEALTTVGSWCAARAEYRPTSRNDMGVRSILEAGYGRCEETNILFLAAARAVGLPVRQAMVPWWQHADGNHAWVEAWTEKGWKYIESGTEFTDLNRTWFAAQAPRMPKVAAHAFGQPDDAGLYRTGPGFALVDNTAAYTRATSVRIGVSLAGEPAPGRDVYFSVPSLGALRPVTRAVTDSRGEARTILGPGIFFVSCAAGEGLAWTMLDTRDMDAAVGSLRADTPAALPSSLQFAHPGPAKDTFDPKPSPDLTRIREERADRWRPFLRDLPAPQPDRLALAGARTPQWLRLLHGPQGPAGPWIVPLMSILDEKDLVLAEPAAMPGDIALALDARKASASAGLSYADDMFLRWVLAPRLHLEPLSAWRSELNPWLGHLISRPVQEKIQAVRERVEDLETLPKTLFGPPLTPGQIHASGYCATDTDKVVLATAALRTLGVPARCQPDFDGLEYFDGRAWVFWQMRERTQAGGELVVQGHDIGPLVDFGISRIEDGHLASLDDLEWEDANEGPTCSLEPGEYVLLAPAREGNAVTLRLTRFEIRDGVRTTLRPQLPAAEN